MNEVMATELANHNVDVEQAHFDMTDANNRAIINFFMVNKSLILTVL